MIHLISELSQGNQYYTFVIHQPLAELKDNFFFSSQITRFGIPWHRILPLLLFFERMSNAITIASAHSRHRHKIHLRTAAFKDAFSSLSIEMK